METYGIETFFLDYANLNFDDLLDRDKRREVEKKLDGLSSIAEPDLLHQLKFALYKPHDLVANEGFGAVQDLIKADSGRFPGQPSRRNEQDYRTTRQRPYSFSRIEAR